MLRELDGVRGRPVEFITTSRHRRSTFGVVIHRVRTIAKSEVELCDGIPTTTVARTIVDLASALARTDLEMALESAIRRRMTTKSELETALSGVGPTHPGRAILRSLLLELAGTHTESSLETLTWRALLTGHLPAPVRQYVVRDDDGNFIARLDFAYPEIKLAIEADGYRFHSSRQSWRWDRMRDNELLRMGWTVYRATWEDVRNPRALCRRVADLISRLSVKA
ncbi:MAG: DUF559 domain-containing protein [Actinomycetota bacterium]